MSLYQPKWRDPATGEQRTGKYWWLQVHHGGIRRRIPLHVTDHRVAQMKAADILRQMERESSGYPVPSATTQAAPKTLVEEYERELLRRGMSPPYARRYRTRLLPLLAGARRLADVTPDRIRGALAAMSEEIVNGTRRTAKTLNSYRVTLSGFFSWLVREGRWPLNPVRSVARVREGEPTRERRALTMAELERLVACAPRGRGLCYRVAATTGLRRSECAAVRWVEVDLEAATLRVRATTAKNRKEAVQPLPPGTVAALRAARGAHASPLTLVFRDGVPRTSTLRKDLRRAGIPFETEEGVVDFHALRVTYATLLALAGVPLAQAMRLMRHSDPKLTARVYTKLGILDGHAAVAKIDIATAMPNASGRTKHTA